MITFKNDCTDPFFNQAFEEYVFENYTDDDIFFLWQNRPAVIVGQNQNIYREVNFFELEKRNIPVVRRMSGGGTVYHDLGNVNYTFISDASENLCYDTFLNPVIKALRSLGLDAAKRGVCDIAVCGLKVSGSAQRTSKGRVLHHGTLLFSADLELLDKITAKTKNESIVTKGTLSTVSAVTDISEHLKEKMSVEEFKSRLERTVLCGAKTAELSEKELCEVKRLAKEKYQSDAWTFGKTPSFDFEKKGIFENRPIEVKYSAKRGFITEGYILCDFLCGGKGDLSGLSIAFENLKMISAALCGDGRLVKYLI